MFTLHASRPALPALLWVANRQRVRAGKGPLRITPAGYSESTSEGVPIALRSGRALYFPGELFASHAEAVAATRELLRVERAREAAKYRALCALFDDCESTLPATFVHLE